MTESNNQPDCALAELIAAALSAARAAAGALDEIIDVVNDGPLVSRVQTVLAGPMPPSEEDLEVIRDLAVLLLDAADGERWSWQPDDAVTPIDEFTPVGRQIKIAHAKLCAARTAAAHAADRWRAEAIIAAHVR